MRSAVLIVSVIFFTEVTPWTIDLPEVRRFYFEKYSNRNDKEPALNENQTFFDNINGDSLHNTHRQLNDDINKYREHLRHLDASHRAGYYDKGRKSENNVYAKAYHHGEYMVRKVSHGVLEHGSAYLEGLRLSIEQYMELLKNCTTNDFKSDLPANMSDPLTIRNFTLWRDFQSSCRRATEASEHVRRLSELALWATKRLQDVSYTAKYSKDASMEENELLLRLAWYLDKLAQLTGYEPNPEGLIPQKKDEVRVTKTILGIPFNLTDEMRNTLLNCLKEKSDVPATERCAIPNLPGVTDQLLNYLNSMSTEPPKMVQSPVKKRSHDDTHSSPLELLEASATDNGKVLAPTLTDVKSVQKRSISDEDNPLVVALKYYAKHKIWEYANPKSENKNVETEYYDVKNNLYSKSVRKQKRSVHIDKHQIHIIDPEHLKEKPLVHHVADKIKIVKSGLEKIFKKKVLAASHAVHEHAKHALEHAKYAHHEHAHHEHAHNEHAHHEHAHVTHFDHIYRHKRSTYTDYTDNIKPRIPLDPQKDISYYVKNKEGTDHNPDLAQALLVRASLEQAFQRGNIAVVHRYGSNYNPLVVNPFYAGVLRSAADV